MNSIRYPEWDHIHLRPIFLPGADAQFMELFITTEVVRNAANRISVQEIPQKLDAVSTDIITTQISVVQWGINNSKLKHVIDLL